MFFYRISCLGYDKFLVLDSGETKKPDVYKVKDIDFDNNVVYVNFAKQWILSGGM